MAEADRNTSRVRPLIREAETMGAISSPWLPSVIACTSAGGTPAARATRPGDPQAPDLVREHVQWGAGPRAGQHLLQAAKALAAIQGEPTPHCEHIRALAPSVLRHRLILGFSAMGDSVSEVDLIDQIIRSTPEA